MASSAGTTIQNSASAETEPAITVESANRDLALGGDFGDSSCADIGAESPWVNVAPPPDKRDVPTVKG